LLNELLGQYKEVAASEAHQAIAEDLRDRILARNSRINTREVKKFEVSSREGTNQTFVVIEIGMVGDEGSLASVFCRDYRHIVIRKRGGLTLLNPKNKKFSRGWFHAVHALTK
jgi:hypothetical protein